MFVKISELARCVDQQAFHLTRFEPGARGDFTAIDELYAASAQFLAHFLATLVMTRDQHQEEVMKFLTQAQKLFGHDGLLAGVRAAADEQGRPRRHAELP